MAHEITLAEVDQAEAALSAAKKGKGSHNDLAREVATLRQAWRQQEEAAGRRTNLVATEGK